MSFQLNSPNSTCLHNGALTFRVKELVAGRNGARGGGAGLGFDAPAVVSREFRCVSTLLASSGGPLRLRAATAHAVGRGRRFDVITRIPLRFDAPTVVSREFRPLLASSGGATGPLCRRSRCGFSRESVAFRRSRCGFT